MSIKSVKRNSRVTGKRYILSWPDMLMSSDLAFSWVIVPSADGDIILFSLHFSGCHELIDNGQGSSKKKNEFSSPFFFTFRL